MERSLDRFARGREPDAPSSRYKRVIACMHACTPYVYSKIRGLLSELWCRDKQDGKSDLGQIK